MNAIIKNGKVEIVESEAKAISTEDEISYKYMQIEALKQQLADTDYKAIKYAEGLISDDEYAETKSQRQSWRDEINQLETEVEVMD